MKFAKPFPHTVIDDFIPIDLVRQINAEWPETTLEDGSFTKKRSSPDLKGAALALHTELGTGYVEEATGIEGLFSDPDHFGGGYHAVPSGGFLKIHVDFNRHPKGWHRRVNALIYLNEGWLPEWGGDLRLGLEKHAVEIAPIAGRCVIFETTDSTWHGHPEKLRCPVGIERRSLAFYYYTADPPKEAAHTTIYRKAS